MVLEEAKILGKPILITDTAAREAVAEYTNSKIFENSREGIYNGLKEVLKNNMEDTNIKYNNTEIIRPN